MPYSANAFEAPNVAAKQSSRCKKWREAFAAAESHPSSHEAERLSTSTGAGASLGTLGRDNLLAVFVVANTGRGSTVAATDARADTINWFCQRMVFNSGELGARGDRWCRRQGSSQLAYADGESDLPVAIDRGLSTEHSCPPLETNVPDNFAVNGARDTVLQLEVHLGDGVLGEDRSIANVACEKRC